MNIPKILLNSYSFCIFYNDNKTCYQTATEEIDDILRTPENERCRVFVSEEDIQVMRDTDTIWWVYWNPTTPVGFNSVIGSSLDKVFNYIEKVYGGKDEQ